MFLSYSLYPKHISWTSQPAIQWVTGFFTWGGVEKRPDPEADHSPKGADQPGNYPERQPVRALRLTGIFGSMVRVN